MNTKPLEIGMGFYAQAAITLLTDGTPEGKQSGAKMVREVCMAIEAFSKGEAFKGEFLNLEAKKPCSP